MGVEISKHSTILQGYDYHGDKISIVEVSRGYVGNHYVQPHWLYCKHRGNAISSKSFEHKQQAEIYFRTKHDHRHDIVIILHPVQYPVEQGKFFDPTQ